MAERAREPSSSIHHSTTEYWTSHNHLQGKMPPPKPRGTGDGFPKHPLEDAWNGPALRLGDSIYSKKRNKKRKKANLLQIEGLNEWCWPTDSLTFITDPFVHSFTSLLLTNYYCHYFYYYLPSCYYLVHSTTTTTTTTTKLALDPPHPNFKNPIAISQLLPRIPPVSYCYATWFIISRPANSLPRRSIRFFSQTILLFASLVFRIQIDTLTAASP
ncbi:hypothetical protein BO83DRAFT_111987 [Aspergillus eucalypticola CBS 122712]|uniref:Uncharacterized protein n=1 Tax=Aspergillus eucalypticola (strain CBS 122712 / IBT 29274) TaxID=1448314 RepID=A0A317UXB4_ASPEC|nr:uncharacterized protein BO83DRAFT_111987 [Aspergillus eucalypticola CBS 122712]PWY66226.1 hypothetical protein BO83DRAFT_111987 [Aspergillus eucalypticola CBS 122712]